MNAFNETRRVDFCNTFRKMASVEFWDDWKPWIAFVLIGLFFCAGWVGELQFHTIKKEAVRRAAINSCISSIPITRKFSLHVQGVNDGFIGVNDAFSVLLTNSEQTVRSTPRADPQYKVRVANLHRLQNASVQVRDAIGKVSELPDIPVPTKAQCQKRGGTK